MTKLTGSPTNVGLNLSAFDPLLTELASYSIVFAKLLKGRRHTLSKALTNASIRMTV